MFEVLDNVCLDIAYMANFYMLIITKYFKTCVMKFL